MKKWRCTVCGHIHEGDAPPAECPLCKASAEMFEELVEKQDIKGRRWKCTVCGYIHEGDSPPAECPICKAGADKFIEIDGDGNALASGVTPASAGAAPQAAGPKRPGLLARMIMALHLHPISVHMPNGILPVAVVFLALAVFMGMEVFEKAAYYNLVAVLITMPLVLLTGYVEWKNRYRGATSFIFITKIFCSIVVTLSLIILVAWRIFEPGVAGPDSPFRMVYFAFAAVMLGATGIAGHLGGKLVFGARDAMTKK